MFIALLDASGDRRSEQASARFRNDVEAVRMGTVFAYDVKAYRRWASSDTSSVGLAGAQLEASIMALARQNSEYVVFGESE